MQYLSHFGVQAFPEPDGRLAGRSPERGQSGKIKNAVQGFITAAERGNLPA
jgi:hypothetical protein